MKATVGSLIEKRKCVSSFCGTTNGAVDTHFSGLPSKPGRVFGTAAWISGRGPKSTGGRPPRRPPPAGGVADGVAAAGAVAVGVVGEAEGAAPGAADWPKDWPGKALKVVSASASSARALVWVDMAADLR